MPTTLVPTVHERIARCNTSIFLDRLSPSAAITVWIDGAELTGIASGSQMHFPVPSLTGGEIIKARQDAGAGDTPWSPEIEVEQVALPPVIWPHLPDEVGVCSQCAHVYGMVPGCDVELFLVSTGAIVGNGRADRNGFDCVGVDLESRKGEGFGWLGARMIVCGQASNESATPIVARGTLPQPVITGPLFGCQRVIPTSNLNPGARVRFEMNTADLGSFCSCWEAVNVWVGTDLVTGRDVRAISYWDRDACKEDGTPSAWEPVVPPDDRIKPVIQPFLVEGMQWLLIDNQIANSSLMIRIRPDATAPFEEFGPFAASQEPEVALNAPLVAGNVVSVVQTLCTFSAESDPLTVLPPPPVVLPPVIVPPLYECATDVQVSGLHQGAFVRLYADSIPIGVAWAGAGGSAAVPANLVAGMKVTARQRVGMVWSADSDPPVFVDHVRIKAPRVMQPVARGDRAVWVSHVTPGAHVNVWEGPVKIGSTNVTEPIVRVPVEAVSGPAHASASLCGDPAMGQPIEVIDSPCSGGRFDDAAEMEKTYADFAVPAVTDGGNFTTLVEGQLYFPSDDGKSWARNARNLPLVVIAHGFWTPDIKSYLGYDYLARHLARWGMVVFSINMDDANAATVIPDTQQYARGEILLHLIDEMQADADVGGRIDFSRVGLIGHSMGGEGVVYAQHLNDSEGRGYGVKGIVSIAPTNYRPEAILRNAKYLQILGSMDLLAQSALSRDHFNGFRIHDRAWYPKTHAWIHGARHNPFNRVWLADGDTYEAGWADIALPPAEHEAIAMCLINAFFQDALLMRQEYAGYMEGTILPQPLRHLQVHMQHRRLPRQVIDNFGDVDEQEGFAAEALNKTTNRLALVASATGAGLATWEDVELSTSAALTPHISSAVEMAWNPPLTADVVYASDAGALSVNAQDFLALRVGQFFKDAVLNPEGVPADLFVTLEDGAQKATVRAGAVAPIPYPDPQGAGLNPLRTIRIPLDAFTAANPSFDTGSITRVSLELTARPTGHLFVDDIEFSS